MILQELHRYYERLLEDPEHDVPREHWSTEKVSWEITLARDGRVVRILPLTAGEGKAMRRFISMMVPEHTGRSGTKITPFFLCDNAGYLFGLDPKRGVEKRAAAQELHESILASCDDEGAHAVCAFFDCDDGLDGIDEERKAELGKGGFATFRLEGDRKRLHERDAVQAAWASHFVDSNDNAVVGQCSVTGEMAPIARLFPQVTGVPGAQSAGASLVSFNLDSFESYGKSQAYNASVSEKVSFNAGSALRYLFADPAHRVRLGDTTVVFWTDRPAPVEEDVFRMMLDSGSDFGAESDADRERIKETIKRIKAGLPLPSCDIETRFFILGVAPNAARLAVRFFETETFGVLTRHYGEYLCDMEMVGVKPRSLKTMLRQVAPLGDANAIPSTLVNSCFHAMLSGERFPHALFQLLLSRTRIDHASNNVWDMGQRAALMKAYLARNRRLAVRDTDISLDAGRSFQMVLDRENADQAYNMGRLFAVLERAQTGALSDLNATIKDRYFGSVAITPSRVLPLLMKNSAAHFSKLRKDNLPLFKMLEKEMDDIFEVAEFGVRFPATLGPEEQGGFYIGYYQERSDLWTSKKDRNQDSNAADE